jgi:hypothetical protein
MTHQTTIKAEMVVMIVVRTTTTATTGMTTAATTRTTIDETTTTIAVITIVVGSTRVAIGIIVMAITISAIPSENVIYMIALTKETTIMHPMKAIVAWNMILPTALRV